MANNAQVQNDTKQGIRETGFPEPLSTERNTTLPHEDAQTAPNEELDTNVITDKSHLHHPHIPGHHNKHRQEQHAKQTQVEMYSGLEVRDNSDDGKPKDGAIKKVLNKLSCGTL